MVGIGETFEIMTVSRVREWKFPVDRFVEYEPKDEAWARPLGFGREVSRDVTLTIPRARLESLRHDPCGATATLTLVPEPTPCAEIVMDFQWEPGAAELLKRMIGE